MTSVSREFIQPLPINLKGKSILKQETSEIKRLKHLRRISSSAKKKLNNFIKKQMEILMIFIVRFHKK